MIGWNEMSGFTRLLTLVIPVVIVTFGFSMLEEDAVDSINTAVSSEMFAIIGSLFGLLFFLISEMGQADDNRSYIANPLTDVLALTGTGWLIIRANELGEGVLMMIGAAIFVIYVLQVAWKQGFQFEEAGGGFWR